MTNPFTTEHGVKGRLEGDPQWISVEGWKKLGYVPNADGTFLTKKGHDMVVVLIDDFWHFAKLCLPGLKEESHA